MFYFLIVFLELGILFFLSRRLISYLYYLFLTLFKSRKLAYYVLAIHFLPGTFLHEIAHFLIALFLLVPVGEFSIFPEITEEGVKLGSVKIGKTDPLRRFIIGLAPVILGLGLLLGGVYYVSSLHLLSDPLVLIALSYLVFQVSNTMFSSKEDMKGALELVITLVLLLSLLLIGGVRIPFEFLSSLKNLLPLFSTISKLLLIPLVVNILVILLIRPIKRN